MGDELFDSPLPLLLQKTLIIHYLNLIHQSVNVLYQNVISSNEDLLLLLLMAWRLLLRYSWLLGWLVFETLGVFIEDGPFVGLWSRHFMRARSCRIDNTCKWSSLIWMVVTGLETTHLLRSLLLSYILLVWNSWESHWLIPLLIRRWLDLSRCRLLKILVWSLASILVKFFILLVCCWR